MAGLGFGGCFIVAALSTTSQLQHALAALCALPLLLLGAFDDVRPLGWRVKLAAQLLVAFAACRSGLVLPLTEVPLVDAIATVLFMVVLTNAFNLSDNMDGLAGGLATAAAVGLAGLFHLQGRTELQWLALVLAAALVGFLLHNWPPARIFMGDSGSLATGMALAVLGVQACSGAATAAHAALIPMLLFVVPLADVALVMTSRRLGERPLFQGATDHLSHRLIHIGLSPRSVLALSYSIALAAQLVALACWFSSWSAVLVTGVSVVLVILGAALLLAIATVDLTEPSAAGKRPERQPSTTARRGRRREP